MKFTKPAIPLDDQIALLRSRGLTIADEERARHYLSFVGYYRMENYTKHRNPAEHGRTNHGN